MKSPRVDITCTGLPESQLLVHLIDDYLVLGTRTVGQLGPGVMDRLRANQGEPLTLVVEEP